MERLNHSTLTHLGGFTLSRSLKILSLLSLTVALLGACAAPATQAPMATTVVPATQAPTATSEPPTAAPTDTTEPPTPTPPAQEESQEPVNLSIYISPDSLGAALEEAFETEHGDVLTIIGGSWCRKLKSEQEAGDIQADVIYGAEPIFFRALAQSGDLLAYTSPQAANVKPEYQWDNGYYTPADLRYIGIVYNRKLVDAADLPTTFDGLNDPEWNKLTTVADATQCSSAFAMAAGFASPDMDMSFFEGAKANGALLSDRAGKLPELVASGEAVLGAGPHDPVVRLQNKAKKEGVESPVDITWSDDGVYVIPRPIAIIADTNRSEAATEIAQAFVDFVLSPAGQKLSVTKGGHVPVRADVDAPAQIPAGLDLIQIDWDWAAKNKKEIQAQFQEIMYGD